jgi:hypothetical protein
MQDPMLYAPEPLLLSIVGGSPQVVTETLYSLYIQGAPLPKHIRIITTLMGKEKILKCQLMGKNGKINQFTSEYNLEPILCSEDDIWVVTDRNGEPLNDAKDSEQHTALADFITEKVRSLTCDTHSTQEVPITDLPLLDKNSAIKEQSKIFTERFESKPGFRQIKNKKKASQRYFYAEYDRYSIHASIAGGRKSMTFLLGYAMSLFGRELDKISHVMVDPKIENWPEFFYPSRVTNIQLVGWDKKEPVDFSQMKVELAEIPLVRMAQNMPKHLISKERSYSDTINVYESFNQNPTSLILDLKPDDEHGKNKKFYKVTCSGQHAWLSEEDTALLWGWCLQPEPVERDDSYEFSVIILACYASLLTRQPQAFQDIIQAGEYFRGLDNAKYSEEFIFGTSIDGGIAGCNYYTRTKKLTAKLEKYLIPELAKQYTPSNTKNREGDSDTSYMLDIDKNKISYKNNPQEK